MSDSIRRIGAKALKDQLHDGQEIALLDAREEVPFDARHLFSASCVPLSRMEMLLHDMVPRRSTRVVWCDDGAGLAERAAARMVALGYTDVSVLEGGIAAWEQAGYRLYNGVHVPSKAFAEVVEHEAGTPWISAEELKTMIDRRENIVILDSRSYEEYHSNSIPGAISVPGAELVYRFTDLVPSPDTTVIVNCGGRTRSIIGAQSLLNAGFPNKIVSLKNGTQAWHLAGYEVVDGATRRPPEVSAAGLTAAQQAAARVAARCGVVTLDKATLATWRAEAGQRTLYVLDVRTPEEYAAGHVPEALSAPGGQLIQETDNYLATWGARVVLLDDNGVRATMTASWLQQMGWTEVAIMRIDDVGGSLVQGPHLPQALGLETVKVSTIDAPALQQALAAGTAQVLDLDWSRQYYRGHIPGAWFAIRARLQEALRVVPPTEMLVLTSPDALLARLAAADLAGQVSMPVKVLAGGTEAWRRAGLPLEQGRTRMANAADDIRLRAREQEKNREEAMREYLTWEIELVNQMATEDEHHFHVMSAGGAARQA
ncbi:MAG: rhodanese-like domain-containing protein [Candidatus Tectimicrobiota bacterium]